MAEVTVELRSLPDTEAAVGWAGAHSIVVDRPAGKAGGKGLGFNGAEILALAIGGCLCNDLRYIAHARQLRIDSLAVTTTLRLGGEPLLVEAAEVRVAVEGPLSQAEIALLLQEAERDSTISNSVQRGVPITLARG
jgi:organic hydroperoxide reductase OsmC/OhrA